MFFILNQKIKKLFSAFRQKFVLHDLNTDALSGSAQFAPRQSFTSPSCWYTSVRAWFGNLRTCVTQQNIPVKFGPFERILQRGPLSLIKQPYWIFYELAPGVSSKNRCHISPHQHRHWKRAIICQNRKTEAYPQLYLSCLLVQIPFWNQMGLNPSEFQM